MNLKKLLQKIKISGNVDYETYINYLKTLKIEEVKDLKYTYENKIIQNNSLFNGFIYIIAISLISGIMYKIIKFIENIYTNEKILNISNISATLILGSFIFGILLCFIIIIITNFLIGFNANKSKKLAIINDFLKTDSERENN